MVVVLSRAWYPPNPGMLLSCEVQDPSKLSNNFAQTAVVQDGIANKLIYPEWSGVWLSGKAGYSHLFTMLWLTVLLVSSLLLKRGFPLTCLSSQAHARVVEKCGISTVFSPQPDWLLQMQEWVLICICSSEWLCKLIWFFQSQIIQSSLRSTVRQTSFESSSCSRKKLKTRTWPGKGDWKSKQNTVFLTH